MTPAGEPARAGMTERAREPNPRAIVGSICRDIRPLFTAAGMRHQVREFARYREASRETGQADLRARQAAQGTLVGSLQKAMTRQ